MLRKNPSANAALATLLLLFTALLLPESVFAISGPPPPDVYMAVTPKALPVASGCPATFNVQLISQEGYRGVLNLAATSTSNGMNATFYSNPVSIREYSEANSKLTVTVSPDTPQGVTSLSVKITSVDRRISHTATVTLNIGPPCSQQQKEQTTTTTSNGSSINRVITVISEITLTQTLTAIQTSTSTTTLLTTFTSTITAIPLEQAVEPLTSAWAIGATIVTLALAEVLLLKRAK